MKVFIFYGTDCNEYTAWIPWLRGVLNKSVEVIIPNFPTPQDQTYKNWKSILDKYKINKEDTIVAWSTGAIFAVRYLYENNIDIEKLICISGFNNYIGNVPEVDNINKDYFMHDISVAKNIAKNIVCIKSDNDPFIMQTALNDFAKQLSAKVINIKGGGHFNANAGYIKFTELLDEIIRVS